VTHDERSIPAELSILIEPPKRLDSILQADEPWASARIGPADAVVSNHQRQGANEHSSTFGGTLQTVSSAQEWAAQGESEPDDRLQAVARGAIQRS